MRLAGLEGEPQRLARPQQMRLPDDAPRSCGRMISASGAAARPGRSGHSLMTSAPRGGVKRNDSGAIFGLRSTLAKRITVVWPNASRSSIASIPFGPNPSRIRSNVVSFAFGVASTQSRPSWLPRLVSA